MCLRSDSKGRRFEADGRRGKGKWLAVRHPRCVHLTFFVSWVLLCPLLTLERAKRSQTETGKRVAVNYPCSPLLQSTHEIPALNLSSADDQPQWLRTKQLVTPAACLANRGLVRFVMKRFGDAAADLRGAPVHPTHRTPGNLPASYAGGAGRGGKGITPALGSTAASGKTSFARGALDTFDCELGRALAEGRLENRASREVTRLLLSFPRAAHRTRGGHLFGYTKEKPFGGVRCS